MVIRYSVLAYVCTDDQSIDHAVCARVCFGEESKLDNNLGIVLVTSHKYEISWFLNVVTYLT